LAIGVPPFGGHAGEFLDFGGVEAGRSCSHVVGPLYLLSRLLHKRSPSSMSTPRRTLGFNPEMT
ncbi:MAG: hypothetical protein KDK75_05470, partial [Alphaproteobacteria bacterium]|nr:hypothetical protein [Alphaproteobacteria bacterium]